MATDHELYDIILAVLRSFEVRQSCDDNHMIVLHLSRRRGSIVTSDRYIYASLVLDGPAR